MKVIIVGTETTQGFTVGIATQVSSRRVWETQPVQRRWTPWRYSLQDSLVRRQKPVNLNTQLPWPEKLEVGQGLSKARPREMAFSLREGYLSGLNGSGDGPDLSLPSPLL